MPRKKTHEEFIKEAYNLVGDEYIFVEKYISSNTSIEVRHTICDKKYKVKPANFLKGHGCPHCHKNRVSKTPKKFYTKVLEIHGDVYNFLSEFNRENKYITVEHKECGYVWEALCDSLVDKRKKGKTFCPKCNGKINYTTETYKAKVSNITNFEFDVLSEYVSKSKVLIRHNICKTEFEVYPSQFLSTKRCPYCDKGSSINHDIYTRKVSDLVGEDYVVLGTYVNSSTKIKMKHMKQDCQREFLITPSDFLNDGIRCSKCSFKALGERRSKSHEEFVSELNSIVPKEYEVLSNYINRKTPVKIKHIVCEFEWEVKPGAFLYSCKDNNSPSPCPNCNKNRTPITTEIFKKRVLDEVGDEYIVKGEYVSWDKKILIQHKTKECEHEYYVTPVNFLTKGARCQQCYFKRRRKTTDQFIQEVYDLVGYDYVVLGDYSGARKNIEFKHGICGNSFYMRPADFLFNNQRCPTCSRVQGAGKTTKKHDEFVQEVEKIHGKVYIFLEQYERSNKHISIKHIECDQVFEIVPTSLLRNKDYYKGGICCPFCSKGATGGERKIIDVLLENNIKFKTQYSFNELKRETYLRFDFAIFDDHNDLIYLIEYDGEQHFFPVDFAGKGVEWAEGQFEIVKENDKLKDDFCSKNKIELIRIPYWEKANIDKIISDLLDCQSPKD